MRTTRASFTFAALALLAAACSSTPDLTPTPLASADNTVGSRAIPVRVSNQNFATMDIYLVRQGTRLLVGQINGLSDATVTIPASAAPADHQIRLRAEAVGGGSASTGLLIVPPGQSIYWTLGADLSLSSASAG